MFNVQSDHPYFRLTFIRIIKYHHATTKLQRNLPNAYCVFWQQLQTLVGRNGLAGAQKKILEGDMVNEIVSDDSINCCLMDGDMDELQLMVTPCSYSFNSS